MTNDDPDVTPGDQPSEPPAARSDKEQVLDHLDKILGRSPSNRRRGRPQSTTPSSAATRDAGNDEPATDAGEPSLASIPMFASAASWTSPDADADDDVPTIDSAGGPDRGWIAEDSQIDWQLVRKLKLASVDRLDEQIKQHRARHDGREPSVADRREMGKPIIAHVVNEHAEANTAQGYLWTPALEDRYFKAVFDSQFGYGRLQPLFEIPTAENITIHGHKVVKVHYADGRTEIWPPVADSDEELLEQLRQMGSNATPARTIDGHQYEMTLMLDERFRLHAYSDEVSGQPRISIRQHRLTNITLGDLVDGGLMPEELARVPQRRRPGQRQHLRRRRAGRRQDHAAPSAGRRHPDVRGVRHAGDRPRAVLPQAAGPGELRVPGGALGNGGAGTRRQTDRRDQRVESGRHGVAAEPAAADRG